MAVFFWHLALSVVVALGAYAGLIDAPVPLPVPPLLIAIAAGYAAGATAFLVRRFVQRAGRSRTERRVRDSWWTPEQIAR
jgi:hypothetical protein